MAKHNVKNNMKNNMKNIRVINGQFYLPYNGEFYYFDVKTGKFTISHIKDISYVYDYDIMMNYESISYFKGKLVFNVDETEKYVIVKYVNSITIYEKQI